VGGWQEPPTSPYVRLALSCVANFGVPDFDIAILRIYVKIVIDFLLDVDIL
jgi:hypothetical protein